MTDTSPAAVEGAGNIAFTALANSADLMVSVEGLLREVTVDVDARTASVPAGMRYAELARERDARGGAVGAMASLPHITVAGAVGVVTRVELAVEPRYLMTQVVDRGLPWNAG